MLRLMLLIALLAVTAGLGFFFGRQRSTVPETTRARMETPPPHQIPQPAMETPPEVPSHPADPALAPAHQKALPPPPDRDAAAPAPLVAASLSEPIANLKASDIHDTFYQSRGAGERIHEASDIMAPRGTPVLAMDKGTVEKLFDSKPGGLTIYLFDSQNRYCFYYAHLDRYAEGLKEGMEVKRGAVIGYVGSTGNADVNAPHLHLAILELGPEKKWWEGNKPVNPYSVLMKLVRR